MATDAILQAASYHAELVSALRSLNDRNPITELEKLGPLVDDLESNLQANKNRLVELAASNQKASQNQHLQKRCKGWRLAYDVVGKKKAFEKKARAVEERFAKGRLEELQAKAEVERCEQLLADLYASRSSLQQAAEKITLIWTQLDELYNHIFDGPTPEFPEEDVWEQRTKLALAAFTNLDIRQCCGLHVLQCLRSAEASMKKLCGHLREITPRFAPNSRLSYTETPKKQLVLTRAINYAREVRNMLSEAQFIQPDLQLLQMYLPLNEYLLVSQAFEDPLSLSYQKGNAYAQLLAASAVSTTALQELRVQISTQVQWITPLPTQVAEAESALRAARANLRRIRMDIFERVVFRDLNPPPEYEE